MDERVWRKSTFSNQGECVEVALDVAVGVRDTKDRAGGELNVPAAAWERFLADLK